MHARSHIYLMLTVTSLGWIRNHSFLGGGDIQSTLSDPTKHSSMDVIVTALNQFFVKRDHGMRQVFV